MLALYGVSIAIVDLFQRQVGGPTPVDELRIQAQVALSVCWTATGLVVLAAGFVRHAARLRHAGLLVLALATAKVFLVDLASMDVAYRALVLFGDGRAAPRHRHGLCARRENFVCSDRWAVPDLW